MATTWTSRPAATRPLNLAEGFVCGGLGACVAVTFSNPAEMAKTRMQLQGELVADLSKRVYKNAPDVLMKTWKNEGLSGLQRGLGAAYVYQMIVNGCRLGFYEPFRHSINQLFGRSASEQFAPASILAGTMTGAVGAALANPLFLVKAQIQAYSPALPVGAQHAYRGAWHGLSSIWSAQGIRGLTNGMGAAVIRTAMGSSVQVPSYMWTKNEIVQRGLGRPDSIWTYLASSAVSGVTLCVVMQPADTGLTRVYNQEMVRTPDGRLVGKTYRNLIDCLWKTARTEGLRGWYKGSTAHFLRIAPHTIITLTANDIIVGMYRKSLMSD